MCIPQTVQLILFLHPTLYTSQALDGFMMVIQIDGTVVFLSDSIHKYLGLFQVCNPPLAHFCQGPIVSYGRKEGRECIGDTKKGSDKLGRENSKYVELDPTQLQIFCICVP